MQTNITWKSDEYNSVENCTVQKNDEGAIITSSIQGSHSNKVFEVDYRIEVNRHWQTVFFEINCLYNGNEKNISCRSDGQGNWYSAGQELPEFAGCMDIDLPLTPFTNSLPINRLQLSQHAEAIIEVIYLDLLEEKTTRVQQRYIRLKAGEYKYENIPNDFEAIIIVDNCGFVREYPALFKCTRIENAG